VCRYQSVARVPENWTAAVASEMQDMWKMLDKMSADDPEAYKKFISEQMKDGENMMKQEEAKAKNDANPSIWRIVRANAELGSQIVVLMREHSKVEPPSWSEDRVPVWISDRRMGQTDDGVSVGVYDAVFHPAVKARAATDKNIQRALICLALGSVSDTHGTMVDIKGWKVLKRAQCKQIIALPFTWQAQSHDGGSYGESQSTPKEDEKLDLFNSSPMLSELSSLGSGTKPQPKPKVEPLVEKQPEKKSCLIEVMSEIPSEVVTPEHQISTDGPNNELVLRVWLPGVVCVSDVDMDISEDTKPVHVMVEVEGQYELEVDLPGDLDTAALSAKFDKAQCLLSLSMPQL